MQLKKKSINFQHPLYLWVVVLVFTKKAVEARKIQKKLVVVIRFMECFLHEKKFGIIETFSLKEIHMERA